MTRMNGWKEEAAAAVSVLTLIGFATLLFIIMMMPFVFPVVLVAGALIARRLARGAHVAPA